MKTEEKTTGSFETDIKMHKDGTIREEEEIKIWEILDLLSKVEYTISGIGRNAKSDLVFTNFEKARKKVREAENLITPLQDRNERLIE